MARANRAAESRLVRHSSSHHPDAAVRPPPLALARPASIRCARVPSLPLCPLVGVTPWRRPLAGPTVSDCPFCALRPHSRHGTLISVGLRVCRDVYAEARST